jgi:hypothetical protein
MVNGLVRPRWRALLAACCFGGGLTPLVAQANPTVEGTSRPVRVHYRVDTTPPWDPCFSHAQTRTAVTRALGRAVFFDAGESDVIVELQGRPDWGARVRLLDATGQRLGTRHLRGKDCNELRELVAFTLAVMVDFRLSEVPDKRSAALEEVNDGQADSNEAGEADAAGEVRDRLDEAAGDEAAGDEASPSTSTSPAPSPARDNPGAAREVTVSNERRLGLTPSLGASADAGATPWPRFGVYGALVLDGAGEIALLVRGRGEHLFAVSRAESRLSAWAASVTVAGCWAPTHDRAAWGYRACGGVTPDWLWVVAEGEQASRTTGFGGLAVEPNIVLNTPNLGAVALELGVGLAVPLVRNSWHAVTPSGAELPLFRAADVRLVGFVGAVLGR